MHRFRTLIVGSCLAALTITALGAPVAAGSHQTRLAIVNGFPAKKIDVCVNGKEIKSRLRYSKKVLKTTGTAKATIKFFSPDPRKCKGKLLGKKTVSLADATVVITKKKPKKILVFDNFGLGEVGPAQPDNYAGAIRQAANVGAVGMVVDIQASNPGPWIPAFDEDWVKGDEWPWTSVITGQAAVLTLFVTKPHSEFAYIGPYLRYLVPDYRYEWIFVGSKDSNTKIVFIKRAMTFGP